MKQEMNYFVNSEGRVYAYTPQQVGLLGINGGFGGGGLTPLSEEEALAIATPPPTKEQRIQEVVRTVNAERDTELTNLVIEYNGVNYDADERTQARMTAVLTLLRQAPEGTTQEWITADNATISLTVNDFEAIGVIIAQRVTEIMFAARTKKDAEIAAIEAE